jgi:hypothetical protein
VILFVAAPLYCSYRSVRSFEAELGDVQKNLPRVGTSEDTLIVAFDSHFLGYRHAGYYLPQYVTVQYPEVKLREGTRVFVMHGRDTRVEAKLDVTHFSRFVLFPLPGEDPEYQKYLGEIKKRFPEGSLATSHLGGHDYLTAPIADLPILFPSVVAHPEPGVYPSLHSDLEPVNSREHRVGPKSGNLP